MLIGLILRLLILELISRVELLQLRLLIKLLLLSCGCRCCWSCIQKWMRAEGLLLMTVHVILSTTKHGGWWIMLRRNGLRVVSLTRWLITTTPKDMWRVNWLLLVPSSIAIRVEIDRCHPLLHLLRWLCCASWARFPQLSQQTVELLCRCPRHQQLSRE